MKALLFDIDGTLVNAQGMGSRVFEAAIRQVTGKTLPMDTVDWMGRTDTDIILCILEVEGYSEMEAQSMLPGIFRHYRENFEDYAQQYPERFVRFPGVLELLEALQDQSLGLLTGNLPESAEVKLAMAGIGHFFPKGIGGFGSERRKRSELVPLALDKMKQHYRVEQFSEVWVIGDSHRDILCGKENGTKTLAVATGRQSLEELKRYDPDIAVPDFSDFESLLPSLTD